MPDVKRTIRLITMQHTTDKPPEQEGFPMRAWSVEIRLLDNNGREMPANLFTKAVYHLHPSFPKPVHTINTVPFKVEEEGWGEFDMTIVLHAVDRGGDHTILHDLNFQSERYEADHVVTFKNPRPALIEKLRESGPVPGDENGTKAKIAGMEKKKSSSSKQKGQAVDMERLAEGLQKLQEDDLLQVVQMVHDNKSPESYIKNDLEQGEFHVDLYTLPELLIKMLWDLVVEKTDVSLE
ncbi:MAG: hypothetical protein M1824_001089 [Vezdaea acicularis]|nr:MAG: hypothetical protein M1824_001089 [Vezdaea acicularis]